MPLVFEMVFHAVHIISWIESIGGGQVGGGGVVGGDEWGANGGLKHPFRLKSMHNCAFSM